VETFLCFIRSQKTLLVNQQLWLKQKNPLIASTGFRPRAKRYINSREEHAGKSLGNPRTGKSLSPSWCLVRVKRDYLGRVKKFKVRLVAKGFTREEGVGYKETFPPEGKPSDYTSQAPA
jgi:hypothetical protein